MGEGKVAIYKEGNENVGPALAGNDSLQSP